MLFWTAAFEAALVSVNLFPALPELPELPPDLLELFDLLELPPDPPEELELLVVEVCVLDVFSQELLSVVCSAFRSFQYSSFQKVRLSLYFP